MTSIGTSGKQLRPMTLQEKSRRRPDRHNQVEFASRKERHDVVDKWSFIPGILDPCRIKRHLKEVDRPWGCLDKLGAKTRGEITPW
jgi:hypothetical protein